MERYKDIKLAIFDLDGTIVHLEVDWKSLKKKLSEYFWEVYGLKSDFSPLHPELHKIDSLLGRRAREDAFTIIREYEMRGVENLLLISEMAVIIEDLKQKGTRLAIFSSNTRRAVVAALKKIGMFDLFETIITIEDVERNKPNPEGLNKLLDLFQIDKSQALFIGDRQEDIEAGRRAGIKALLTTRKDYVDQEK